MLERLPFQPSREQLIRFAISLALATLLWGWVTQIQDPYTRSSYTEMPIQTGEIPDSLQVVTTLDTGTVTLEGPQSTMDQVNRGLVTLSLDTSSVTEPGEYRVPVVVDAPDGASERTIEPSNVSIEVEERISRVFPLTVETMNDTDSPTQIEGVTPEVTQVTVTGPSSAVERVNQVILPVTLETETSDFEMSLVPYAVDSGSQRISEVDILPQDILTNVEVETRGTEVTVIPQMEGSPAEGHNVQFRVVAPDAVLLDGPDDVIDDLLFVNTEPVDISDASGDVSQQVSIADLPEGVSILDPSSGTVEVRVSIIDTEVTSQTFTGVPIEVTGTGSGLSAVIDPMTARVTVDASPDTLGALTASDLRVRVDVTGMSPGTYSLQPEISTPQGVSWTGNEPGTVRVTIRSDTPPTASDEVTDTSSAATPAATPVASPAPEQEP